MFIYKSKTYVMVNIINSIMKY